MDSWGQQQLPSRRTAVQEPVEEREQEQIEEAGVRRIFGLRRRR